LTWKYSKTKIGNNFLPGLARCNLNADLNVSVLGKKVSKFKMNSDAFLILISGRCSWREDVSATSMLRREPKTSIQSNVRGRDVTCRTQRRDCQRRDLTWRRQRHQFGGRLRSDFIANPAKIFITIWFESYIVVSQAFWL